MGAVEKLIRGPFSIQGLRCESLARVEPINNPKPRRNRIRPRIKTHRKSAVPLIWESSENALKKLVFSLGKASLRKDLQTKPQDGFGDIPAALTRFNASNFRSLGRRMNHSLAGARHTEATHFFIEEPELYLF